MIYVTGDTHGEFKRRFSIDSFPEQREMTKDDYLIVCGDFGGVWDENNESKSEKWWLDWFEERNYTLLFIDGNHENYDRLKQYPQQEWKGGKVHVIRPHVLHLLRGQVFDIDGKKIFTFGGAKSHDISGGILEPDDPDYTFKKKKMIKSGISFRTNHLDWWAEEMPTQEEMEEGICNLEKNGYSVDYIITHCCATKTQNSLTIGRGYDSDALTDYLERIKGKTEYAGWFFGHYHSNKNVSEKEKLIYEKIIRSA